MKPNHLHLEHIDNLKLRVLEYSIRKDDAGKFHWDEHGFCSDWVVAREIATSLKQQLSSDSTIADVEAICALGHSGIVVGTLVSNLTKKPLIWVDTSYRIVPASRAIQLSQKEVCLVDSLVVHGWNAINSLNLLKRYEATCKHFFVIVDCNNFSSDQRNKLNQTLEIHSILDVKSHMELFDSVMDLDKEELAKILLEESFWRRLD